LNAIQKLAVAAPAVLLAAVVAAQAQDKILFLGNQI
jgi:hypothetical protein